MAQAPTDRAVSDTPSPIISHQTRSERMIDGIEEETLQTVSQDGKKQTMFNAFCDICFLSNFSKIAASYLCYLCKQYVCSQCYKKHDKEHDLIRLESKGSERESSRREFLGEMRNERKRKKGLNTEKVCIVDRLNVNYDLDKSGDCWITGLCGVNKTSWAISDHQNYCIKIFSVGSNILQRYIRFEARPWDVTEINIKREPTEQDVMSARDFSVTNRAEPDKQCLLAVTIPRLHSIWFIDVTQIPAKKTKSIDTGFLCYAIDFSEDKIFTLCSSHGFYYRGKWVFSMMSTDGVAIKKIPTDIDTKYVPYLTACHGRIYITDWEKDKVICIDNDGKEISHKEIRRSMPFGITRDPDNNTIYICAWGHSNISRLDSSLESLEHVFALKSPETLCFHRDKLYLAHSSRDIHKNIVSVVRVL